jgi:hypothetical protein
MLNDLLHKRIWNQQLLLFVSCAWTLETSKSQSFLSSKAQRFFIGGFAATSQQSFLQNWGPVLEEYLNEVVGPQFNPEINFTLIPVDFEPTVTSQDLISSGKKLDFICTPVAI